MKSSYTKRALAFWLAVAMVATSAPMAFATGMAPGATSPISTTTSSTPVTTATSVHHIKLNQESVTVTGKDAQSVTVTAHSSEGESSNSIENNKFKWSVSSVGGSGVSIAEDTGVITVDAKAKAGDYTIKAVPKDGTVTGEATATLKVVREAVKATTIKGLYVHMTGDGGKVDVTDDKSIEIPAGESRTLSAEVLDQFGDPYTTEAVSYTSNNPKVTIESSNTLKVADDATGTATITAKCGDVNKSFEVKVAKKKTEDVSIVFKDFKKTVEYTGEPVVNPTVEVKVGGETKTGNVTYKYEPVALVNALSEDVGKDSVTDVGTYRVTATYDDNAGHVGYVSDTFEITPKKVAVTAKSGTKISKVYDGTTTMSSSLSESDFDIAGKVGSDTLTLDVTNTGLAYPNADVGTYTVNVPVKLTGDDAKNYELSASTVSVPAEITKAVFTGTKEQSVSVLANKADTYTFDMPTDVAGLTDLSVSIGTGNSGDVVESATIRNNQLEIKTKSVASGKTQVVNVTVNSKNYQAFTVKYTLNVVDKTDVSNKITFADKTETYKSGVSYQLSDPKIDLASATGKWTYTWSKDGVQTTSSGSATMPKFTEVGTYRVTATYEDDANLGRKTATLTIKPAESSNIAIYAATQLASRYDDNYSYFNVRLRDEKNGYARVRADANDYLVNQKKDGTSSEWIGMTIEPKVGSSRTTDGLWVAFSKTGTWYKLKDIGSKRNGDLYITDVDSDSFDLWFDTDDRDRADSIYLATNSAGTENLFELEVDFNSYSGSSSSSSGSSSSDTSKVDGDRVSTTTVDKTPSVKNGSATVTFSSSALSDALDENKKEAKREKADKTYIELDVKTSKSVDDTTITVPRSSLDKLADEDTGLKLTTNQGTVTFDYRALAEIYDACDKTNIEFYLEEEDDDQYVLLIKDGSSDVIDLGRGSVEVTFDYKLKSGEKSSDVKVYRIGNGDKTWLSTYGGSTVYGAADVYAAVPTYVTDMKADYSSSKKKVTFTTDALGTFLITTDTLKTGSGSTTTTPTYNAFVDVPSSRWSATYINKLASLGIINGTGGGYFEPTLYVTREEFVKMLAGVAGANVTGYTSSRFPDVPLSRWSAPYIAWAADRGITTGTDGGNFAPTMRITREEMATMIYRYVQSAGKTLPAKNAPVIFADANLISGWAQTPVSVMQQAGIIDGNVTNGRYTFDPKVSASREECAKMLAVLYDLVR